jgi:hypothetical protein
LSVRQCMYVHSNRIYIYIYIYVYIYTYIYSCSLDVIIYLQVPFSWYSLSVRTEKNCWFRSKFEKNFLIAHTWQAWPADKKYGVFVCMFMYVQVCVHACIFACVECICMHACMPTQGTPHTMQASWPCARAQCPEYHSMRIYIYIYIYIIVTHICTLQLAK